MSLALTLRKLMEQAKQNPKFLHALVFDPESILRDIDYLAGQNVRDDRLWNPAPRDPGDDCPAVFADCRVRLEQGKFVFAQTTGFVQDLIGNPDFADVMNKSA